MAVTIEYKGKELTVRTGAWDDVMNSCFYEEIETVGRYVICVDKDGVIFARNNYNY